MWITPDPLAQERELLGGGKINVESLILLSALPARVPSPIGWERVAAKPGEGRGCAEIVAGAWDFERINRRYARPLKVLAERNEGHVEFLRSWKPWQLKPHGVRALLGLYIWQGRRDVGP